MASTTAQSDTSPSTDRSRWVALGVIAVAQLMVALDATIVNVALPTAQASLGFDDAQRSWVITAYTLSFAGLLLLGGRISDRVGRRRAMMIGLTGFAASSALAGAATNLTVLVAGRSLQGACAALMAPAALSLIAVTFTSPEERGKAFGVFGAIASSGAVTGLLLGGVLTEYAGWRWCLDVNVVIAAITLLVGRRVLPRGDGFPTSIDAVSGVLATGALAALVLGCSQAATHGWGSVEVLVPGALGLVLGAAFIVRQGRIEHPLLPLVILRNRNRATAYLAVATSVIGTFGMFLMLTYHFQVVLGYSPLRTGVAFLPLNLAVIVSSGVASRLMASRSARALVAPGLLVASSGLALLARLDPSSGYLTLILPAMVLAGAGVGFVFTPSIGVATSDIEPRMAGIAAATANTAMQIGASVGTAALNTIAIEAARGYSGSPLSATVHGFATATGSAAAVLVVVASVVAVALRPAAGGGEGLPVA
ncbi:MAG TPA: MFS transporter [Marmoricola sp.]|nr:MFS transporter [Marmoricola sp.]